MSSRGWRWAVVTAAALFAIAAAVVAALATSTSSSARPVPKLAASKGDPDATSTARPVGDQGMTYEAYQAAARAYPAQSVPLSWLETEQKTFDQIAAKSKASARASAPAKPNAPPNPNLTNVWQQYGPQQYATYPGILDYGGAGYHASGRTVALAISQRCSANSCTMYAGPNAGGVWRTDNALDADPTWKQLAPFDFAQTTVGDIVIDPSDPTDQTIYVGTGEPNACSSGCPAGVGLYKSTNGGASFTKLPDLCVSNATYSCISPNKDSFLGRGISEIVVDPTNPQHLLVGSATAVRGINHVIGLGGQRRFDEPGPNPTGLYESFDGGQHFTPAWVPAPGAQSPPGSLTPTPGRRGVIDVGLDPNDTRVVYASAFDMGVWRRCPGTAPYTACGGEVGGSGQVAQQSDFRQVFAPRFPGQGGSDVERTMFDLTIAPNNSNKTRIYLTTGRGSTAAPAQGESSSGFWRTDNANQPAATLLATEPSPPAAGPSGQPAFGSAGAVYNGWQSLTTPSTASPYWATHNFCTSQCWYDQDVFTPKDRFGRPTRPNDVYVIGSYNYNEMTCYTKGTNFCASGISNTRGILYSNTAGDIDPNNLNRTFTDMTWDAQNEPANWCAYPDIPGACLVAHNAQHPDQHEILINPNNPSQFFESSDGGTVRSDGKYVNLGRACDFRALNNPSNAYTQCRRLLSRIPNRLTHINQNIGSTLQFINVAAEPSNPCLVVGGTQDNGTWMPGGNGQLGPGGCDEQEWFSKIYGDGGNAGFDAYPDDPALPKSSQTGLPWAFTQFTSPTIDANFRGGVPDKWVVISGPIASTEAVGFYQPQIPDPNPPFFGNARTHPIFVAQLHVWRSWAFGAGRPTNSVPQQVVPDVQYYEANCPEFFTSASDPNCGDFQPLGGSPGPNQPGDLTGNVYGDCSGSPAAARCGGGVSWIARRGADFNTMWATTSAGRVFVTFNANAENPADVVWYRVDNLATTGGNPCASDSSPTDEPNCSPRRVPTGIYPDPSNVNVAYITYTGYNASTPTTPGHLFRVILTRTGGVPTAAAFVNLNLEAGTTAFPTPTGTGDLPAADVVMDDATRALYVATDFGVLRGTPSSGSTTTSTYSWSTTPGMPRYEIAHLALVGGQRDACRMDQSAAAPICGNLLYAATHSQGIWLNKLR